MALFSILVDIAARTAGLEQGVDRANRRLEGFAANATKIGKAVAGAIPFAAIAAGAQKAVQEAVEYADAISKAAVKSGLATKAISELAFAASKSDIEIGTLSDSLRNLQVSVSQAASGNKSAIESFTQLGINFARFKELKTDEQFEVVAQAIDNLKNASDKNRASLDIFKKSGAELLPAFQDGARGIREAREEAEKLGLSLGEGTVKTLTDIDDATKALANSFKGLGVALAEKVGPGITTFLDQAKKYVTGDFTKTAEEQLQTLIDRERQLEELTQKLASTEGFNLSRFLIGDEAADKSLEKSLGILRNVRDEIEVLKKSLAPKTDDKTLGGLIDPAKAKFKRQDGGFSDEELDDAIRNRSRSFEQLDEAARNAAQRQRDFVDTLETGVLEGLENQAAIAQEAIDNTSVSIEGAMEASSAFASAINESLFTTVSGLFENLGQGADKFAATLLQSFKKIIADQATRKLFEYLSTLGSSTGGNGNAFLKAIGSVFAGARAGGGPVSAGKGYLVGERGPEFFMPGRSGTIIPNGAGGAVVVNMPVNIDARGATKDGADSLMSQLPFILKRNNQALKNEITTAINRGQFGLK